MVSIATLSLRDIRLKVVENNTIRETAYDFHLTFHSKDEPLPYRFRHKRRFQSKIVIFQRHPFLCLLWNDLGNAEL